MCHNSLDWNLKGIGAMWVHGLCPYHPGSSRSFFAPTHFSDSEDPRLAYTWQAIYPRATYTQQAIYPRATSLTCFFTYKFLFGSR